MNIVEKKISDPSLEPSRRLKRLLLSYQISVSKISRLTGIDRHRFYNIYKRKKPCQLYIYEAFKIGEVLTPENPLHTVAFLLGTVEDISNQLSIPE